MLKKCFVLIIFISGLFGILPVKITAQHQHYQEEEVPHVEHEMWMLPLGDGWHFMGMGQIFPLVTLNMPFDQDHSLSASNFYFTQPTAMMNIISPNSRWVLRTSLSFEGLTIPGGESTFGSWGEGFIDKRHPHTLLHEAMISYNVWDFGGGVLSVSAGKGFATFGTDDPMARPVQKFPTNHHLSQILERFQVQAGYLAGGWGFEASLFGGEEPTDPYDFSNIESFADSWSVRLSRRFGHGFGPLAEWEISASAARVMEHEDDLVNLYNVAVRHAKTYTFGSFYGLAEASLSAPEQRSGYVAFLGEGRLQNGRHQAYYRAEYSTRPEYSRSGAVGTEDFFRYEHSDLPVGATLWFIQSLGYGYALPRFPAMARAFIELQYHRVWHARGQAPGVFIQNGNLLSISAGFRLFFGGDMLRMGSYGMLDPMTVMHRQEPMFNDHPPGRH